MPANAGALIDRRIKRLSPAALKLARVAAVASGDFSAALAAGVLGCDLLDLADAWGELEAAHVLANQSFAHDLVYEAVRRSVPPAIARALHAGVAEVLQRGGAPAGSVAAHWLAADDMERAVAPLRQAAEQAVATTRLAEAANMYAALAKAHERRGDQVASFDALHQRVLVLHELESGTEVDDAIEAMNQRAQGDAQQARVQELLARRGLVRWEDATAHAAAGRAMALARRAGSTVVECDARLAMVEVLLRRRRPDEAAVVLAPMQDWAHREASAVQRNHFQQCEGWLALESERFGQALNLWRDCAAAAAQAGSMSDLAIALSYQMLALGAVGQFRKAAELGERERALMVEHRMLGSRFDSCDLNLAHVYVHCARYADALAALEHAAARSTINASVLALRHALVYLALGQPGRARQAAQQALEQANMPALRHLPLLMLARIEHAMRPAGDAQALVGNHLAEADTRDGVGTRSEGDPRPQRQAAQQDRAVRDLVFRRAADEAHPR